MSRKNFGAKPLCYPQPVFIIATYDKNGTPNAMNAAWGGISEENEISLCLSPEHKTCKNFAETGAFTVSMADADHVTGCDYVGIASGNDVEDKFSKAGFTATKSEFVNAPVIEELPFVLECKVISYDEKTSRLLGSIENIAIEENFLTEDGKVDVKKLSPLTYDSFNHDYIELGNIVGKAFSDGKKFSN